MEKNDRAAIILIHGFTGNPSQMAWLGEKLEHDGFAVVIPTLKGHGTKPDDMFQCSYRDWIAQTEEVLVETQHKFKTVCVAGLSMGGTLALRLAAHHRFDGLITLAAPIRLPLRDEIFTRSLHWLVKWRHKANGSDIKDRSALQQLNTYNSYPTQSAAEFFKLLREIRPVIPKITMPVLIMHGKEDHVVPVANAHEIYQSVASQEKKPVILENSYHILTMDYDRERVYEEMMSFVAGVLEKHIFAVH